MIGKAQAEANRGRARYEVKRDGLHALLGRCAVDRCQNRVWVEAEPVFDSPINLGSPLREGAAVRDHGITHDSRRLKYR